MTDIQEVMEGETQDEALGSTTQTREEAASADQWGKRESEDECLV